MKNEKNKKSKRLLFNDILLNCVIVALCILVPIIIRSRQNGENLTVVVSGKDGFEERFSLCEDITTQHDGVVIKISQNKVSVVSSDCPDGICVKTKDAENVGDSIVCVPNKVSVKIVSEKGKKGADVVAG